MLYYHYKIQPKWHYSVNTWQKNCLLNRYSVLPLFITLALYSNHGFSALTAVTSQTIKGNAPELSAALQAEIASDRFSLLNLVAIDSSGTAANYQADNDPAFIARINSIEQLGKATLDDIISVLARDVSGTLSSEIKPLQTGDAFDADDDGNFSLTGTSTAAWYYTNTSGIPVKITNTNQSICTFAAAGQTPYIQVSVSDLTLLTQYGDPADNSYGNTIKKFNIKPPIPFACYAKPNLNYGGVGTEDYAGPTNIWNPSYGFISQDISAPSSNFPTTGSNELSFYLTTFGTTSADILLANNTSQTSGNITVTLSVDDQSPANPNVLKVSFTGPKDGSTFESSKVNLPAQFRIKASVNDGSFIDIYTFVISKWFIAKPSNGGGYLAAQTYCAGFNGYTVPSQADYTNQFHGLGVALGGHYTRDINGALFSEWGHTSNKQSAYTTIDWRTSVYWVNETRAALSQYVVLSHDGYISAGDPSNTSISTACVSN